MPRESMRIRLALPAPFVTIHDEFVELKVPALPLSVDFLQVPECDRGVISPALNAMLQAAIDKVLAEHALSSLIMAE